MDLDAQHYKNHSQQQYERAQSLFAVHDFVTEASILDVGCGDGKITAEIAALVPKGKVLGIDASPNMIQLAQSSFNLPNLEFRCVKAEEISMSNLFDNIFSFNCFLWIRQPKEALKRLAKLLKLKGELVILTYLKESAYVDILEEALALFPTRKKLSAANTMLTLDEYRSILESNDLDIQIFKVSELVTCYNKEEELYNYLKGWIASYVPLSQKQQSKLLRTVVHNCFKSPIYREGDSIGIPFKALVIKAIKNS